MSGPPPQNPDDRARKIALSLDAVAYGFQFGVAPALLVSAVVMTAASRGRPVLMIWLAALAAAFAAVVVARLCAGLATLLLVQADHAQTSVRIERLLERLSVAGLSGEGEAPNSVGLKARLLAEIRHAARAGQWDEADALVRAFAAERPNDPDAARAAEELSGSRRAAGEEVMAKIAAAREANDADRVIELRDAAKSLLDAETLRALDRDLAKWFMIQIQRRLRTGSVRPDVADLAAKVSDSLDETPEGASLRASLPTLRRAAGLCARCGRPYKGIADACPACTTAALPAVPFATPATPPGPADDPEPDPETADDSEPVFREPEDGTPDPFRRV